MVKCESYKYYNELIEDYCQKHSIDMTLFVENRLNNKRGAPKDRLEKLRRAKKNQKSFTRSQRRANLSMSSKELPKRYWSESESRSSRNITSSSSTLTKYSQRHFKSTYRSQKEINEVNLFSQKEMTHEKNFISHISSVQVEG